MTQNEGVAHSSQSWTVSPHIDTSAQGRIETLPTHSSVYALQGTRPTDHRVRHNQSETSTYYSPHLQNGSPVMLHVPYVERPCPSSPLTLPSDHHASSGLRRSSPTVDPAGGRYNPYPTRASSFERFRNLRSIWTSTGLPMFPNCRFTS